MSVTKQKQKMVEHYLGLKVLRPLESSLPLSITNIHQNYNLVMAGLLKTVFLHADH